MERSNKQASKRSSKEERDLDEKKLGERWGRSEREEGEGEGGEKTNCLQSTPHILSFSTKMRVHRAFIMPHFTYCSSVWHSCLNEDSDRLERLHERALRYVFNDFCNGHDSLCYKIGYSLSCRRKQDMCFK